MGLHLAQSWFRQSGFIPSHPPAGNASRWAICYSLFKRLATMKYHAKIEYGDDTHYWWNYGKEKIISSLIIPFINGQVVLVQANGLKTLFNMRNVTALTIYKTDNNIERSPSGSVPSEFHTPDFNEHACTEEILDEVKASLSSASFSSLLQKAFAPPKLQVFVIMQFGDTQLEFGI